MCSSCCFVSQGSGCSLVAVLLSGPCLPEEAAAGSRCPAGPDSSGSASSQRSPTSGVTWNIHPFPHAMRSCPELFFHQEGPGAPCQGSTAARPWGCRSCRVPAPSEPGVAPRRSQRGRQCHGGREGQAGRRGSFLESCW